MITDNCIEVISTRMFSTRTEHYCLHTQLTFYVPSHTFQISNVRRGLYTLCTHCVYCTLCTVYIVHCVYYTLCTVYSVHYTLCTVYTVSFTLCILHCVHYTLCTLRIWLLVADYNFNTVANQHQITDTSRPH